MLFDVVVEVPRLVEDGGFKDVTTERRTVPIGGWAGSQGRDASDSFIGAFVGMKSPILHAGGFGIVSSETEFDELIEATRKEWDTFEGAHIEIVVVYGQKWCLFCRKLWNV